MLDKLISAFIKRGEKEKEEADVIEAAAVEVADVNMAAAIEAVAVEVAVAAEKAEKTKKEVAAVAEEEALFDERGRGRKVAAAAEHCCGIRVLSMCWLGTFIYTGCDI